MEMPTPCSKCKEVVELNDLRESNFTKEMLCDECYSTDSELYYLVDEAKDIQRDLEDYAEHMKGDRRGWKKKLKELKKQIDELGGDVDDLLL